MTIMASKFLSTPSARRATQLGCRWRSLSAPFLSTPSARRATSLFTTSIHLREISIHALREEGDVIIAFLNS